MYKCLSPKAGKRLWLALSATLLLVACSKQPKDEPLAPSPSPTQPNKVIKKEETGYRCILEVWTDRPAIIDFWNCSWHGELTQDGKPIPSQDIFTIFEKLGQFPIEKYYKTEFTTSRTGLLTLNFWMKKTDKSGDEDFEFRYLARYYQGNKLLREDKPTEKRMVFASLGFAHNSQVSSPWSNRKDAGTITLPIIKIPPFKH